MSYKSLESCSPATASCSKFGSFAFLEGDTAGGCGGRWRRREVEEEAGRTRTNCH